jgi:hypothetical protein
MKMNQVYVCSMQSKGEDKINMNYELLLRLQLTAHSDIFRLWGGGPEGKGALVRSVCR